jgi:hypothetical protein
MPSGFRCARSRDFCATLGLTWNSFATASASSYRIDAASLQPLGDLLEAVGADGGLVVISGQFTPNAVALANRRGLQLLDGSHLEELILAGQRGVRRGVDASRQREALERIERLVLGGGAPRPDERSLPSSAAQRPGHDLERPRGREAAEDAHEDLELAVGDALSALIHAETHTDAVPSAAGAAASIEPVARPRLTVQRSAGLRIGRVLDAIGMLIAGGLIWNAYAWFEALPVSSQGTPWRLAASVVPSPDTPGPTRPSREESATVRPLGRFEFGPAVQKSSSEEPEAPGRRALPAQETAEEYRSAQELEAAFNAKYVPPPECYDFSSAGQMASCGNHRIRSRRAFIESNGQSFDPAAAIQEAGQPRITQDEETGWIAPEEGALAGSEPARGWESQRAWATKPGWLSQDREAAKRRRAMSDWSARGGWQPRREPLDDRAQEDGSDRQSEMDRQPRIQRQAVQDWRAPSGWRSQPEPSHHPRPAGNSQWQHKWLKEPEPSGAQDW